MSTSSLFFHCYVAFGHDNRAQSSEASYRARVHHKSQAGTFNNRLKYCCRIQNCRLFKTVTLQHNLVSRVGASEASWVLDTQHTSLQKFQK